MTKYSWIHDSTYFKISGVLAEKEGIQIFLPPSNIPDLDRTLIYVKIVHSGQGVKRLAELTFVGNETGVEIKCHNSGSPDPRSLFYSLNFSANANIDGFIEQLNNFELEGA